MRLAVVIVHYRTPALVLDCLETLLPQLEAGRDVAVVVDNGSEDGSLETLREALEASGDDPRVRLLAADRNGGFSAGNNVGIRSVEAEHYLLLNSDTLVREGAIATLLAAAERWPNALLSPRLEWPDASPQVSCFRDRSPASEVIAAAHTGPITRLLSRFDVPLPVQSESQTSEWTSFACVLIGADVFERVGLMDESYFMYFEDIDFCRSARAAGFEVRNVPEARVVHLRGGSSSVKSSAQARKPLPAYYYRSRSRYFAKWYGVFGLWSTNVLWWSGRAISWLREWVGSKESHTCQGEGRDLWTGAGRPLAAPPESSAPACVPRVVWDGSASSSPLSPSPTSSMEPAS